MIAGRFFVVRFIARGGMGEVYEVEDHLLHRSRVALKMVLPEIAADAEASHRFMQEVLLARQINHPNLCQIYEIFRCDESPPAFLFLTMKLLRGETLDSCIRRGLMISRDDSVEIFRQMVDGTLRSARPGSFIGISSLRMSCSTAPTIKSVSPSWTSGLHAITRRRLASSNQG